MRSMRFFRHWATACTALLLAACGSSHTEPDVGAPAARPAEDGQEYLQAIAGAWFPNNVGTLAELIDTSSAIVLGETVSAEIGHTNDNGELGSVYYADVLVRVDELLIASNETRALSEGQDLALEEGGHLRIEFFLGEDRADLAALDALLPREPALWFVQSPDALYDVLAVESGSERGRFPDAATATAYLLTDVDSGLITEDGDGTVGFPLVESVPPVPPDASVPPEDPAEHEAIEASFPVFEDGALAFDDLLARLRS